MLPVMLAGVATSRSSPERAEVVEANFVLIVSGLHGGLRSTKMNIASSRVGCGGWVC